MRTVREFACVLATTLVFATSSAMAAENGNWSVSKSSGEVWMTASGVQQASLKPDEVLKPGDTIRTGRNGRVLLTRGEETILIAPNSVVGLPAEQKEGLSTTIVQKAGSILLEVEKKNVKHFEVETPYLAAVVKGTQFRVTVNASSTSVDVIRGQVQVADFKSGQIAQVMPGQHATAFAHGKPGLTPGGSGTFSPIEHGKPRPSSVERVPVPRAGLSAPGKPVSAALTPHRHGGGAPARHGVTRISSSLGEVKLNLHKVTHGLARGQVSTTGLTRNASNGTVWSSGDSGSQATGNSGQSGNSTGAAASTSTASSVAATVAAATGGGNNGNGNGNGNGTETATETAMGTATDTGVATVNGKRAAN
jgi:FecR protein